MHTFNTPKKKRIEIITFALTDSLSLLSAAAILMICHLLHFYGELAYLLQALSNSHIV